jgi:hypothetical protein
MLMSGPIHPEGNGGGGSKGMVDLIDLCVGCSLFQSNPQHPVSDEDLPIAIGQSLQRWMQENPIRVRETLPVVKKGNMIALFIWFDRAGP